MRLLWHYHSIFAKILCAIWLLSSVSHAGQPPQKGAATDSPGSAQLSHNIPFPPSYHPLIKAKAFDTESSEDCLSINRRGTSNRPSNRKPNPQPKPTPIIEPEVVYNITFFDIDFYVTDADLKLTRQMLQLLLQILAGGLVGWELHPQNNLHFRLGAFDLNLYGVTEALTQAIVEAVVKRFVSMVLRGFNCMGVGEVMFDAGVRVLFAAGIRLQGLEDVNEMVVRPLANWIG